MPMLLNHRALYSAVPPKIETVRAYGRPTPRARRSQIAHQPDALAAAQKEAGEGEGQA